MHSCLLGLGPIDENQELSVDLLTYFEGCLHPLCMVFTPFCTTHQSFHDLSSLLAEHQISPYNKVEFRISNATGALDAIDIYYGNGTDIELNNFTGFLRFNPQLQPTNNATYVWKYSVVIAVGRNKLSGEMVDIPISMFPWTSVPFSINSETDIFQRDIPSGYVSMHQLIRACVKCLKRKKPCIRLPGMVCAGCDVDKCEAEKGEEYGRAEAFYESAAVNSFAFSPAYQHLIQCVKVATQCNKVPRMNAAMRQDLKMLVQTRYSGHANPIAEQEVIRNSRSAQAVEFRHGDMKVLFEKEMQGVFGFTAYPQSRLAKVKVASVTPHLGLASPDKSYSIVDAAISRPGEIFYMEDSVMFMEGGKHVFRPARIFMVGGVPSEDCMSFVVGWIY